MTIAEIQLVIKSYADNKEMEMKATIAQNYNLASMISAFIGCSFNGEDIPSLNSLYPNLFKDSQEEVVDNSWLLVKEMMLDFTQEANKRRKGGNK